jgi:hypothetical protein
MIRAASYSCKIRAMILEQAIMCLTPETHRCEPVDVVEEIDYETFWAKYMYPNKPVIIRGLTKTWLSQEWNQNGKPDFARLRSDFGNDEICVAKCGQQHFSDQACKRRRFWSSSSFALPLCNLPKPNLHLLHRCGWICKWTTSSAAGNAASMPRICSTARTGDS